eukprot:200229_1
MAGNTDNANFTNWVKQYHFISWEYRNPPVPSLSSVNWEDPHVVSIFIARYPIDRLLDRAGLPEQTMWEYVKTSWSANNYALNILADNDHSEKGFEKAKRLLNRFTYILDMACLDENLIELSTRLNWTHNLRFRDHSFHKISRSRVPAARERIGDDEIWRYLLKQNKYDIMLYEWLKTKSLIKCQN